ncbi:flagellar brake protein [Paenibacillus shunpengii]|uniref:Flagellar brake protein n=1 Tax=Paenibacillus shunpengii TaxID=2054424 RepID=A0ABW5SSR2_9BACL|nr:flagellar brake domain-containing protein [Paenibacillus sp. PDC88]SDW58429.1 c-di-GMP-binding flagellar brake protein YcgR, contains PilZNR and PilZ domains [Paenibacillus sp. PDC88]
MNPKVNEVLYVQIPSTEDKEKKLEYKSRVAEVEEDSISIEVPMLEGKYLHRLRLGDELAASFVSEGGVKHFFNTYVTGFKEDVIRLIKIRRPSKDEISQVQRRNYLRVQAKLELAVKFKHDFTRFLAYTDDVSGGGLSFFEHNSYSLEQGQSLSCWLLLPYKNGEIEHVPFEASVVRIQELESGRRLVMLEFISITDMERQKVIKYCFERQLDFRGR